MTNFWTFFYLYGILYLSRRWYIVVKERPTKQQIDNALKMPTILSNLDNTEAQMELIKQTPANYAKFREQLPKLPLGILNVCWLFIGTTTHQSALFWILLSINPLTILLSFANKKFAHRKTFTFIIIRTLIVCAIYYFKFIN